MSDMYVFADKEQVVKHEWKPLILKLLIAVLALFLIAEFAFYLLVIPATSTIRVDIKGSASVGYDEICAITGISGREKWFSFNTVGTAALLAAHPSFEKVSVEKNFPTVL